MSVQSGEYESACDRYELAGKKLISDCRLPGNCPKLDILAVQKHVSITAPTALLVGDENALVLASGLGELSEQQEIPRFKLRSRRGVKMANKCAKCGRTESQTTADAKTLGLLQELHCGVYTCCQMAEWADEQWLAWVEATQQDSHLIDDVRIGSEFSESEVVLVPVRLRRQQVPWYRNTNDLS